MATRVLIAGVSTRGFAESAARAGYEVVAVDGFGDLDLRACAAEVYVARAGGRFSARMAAAMAQDVACELGKGLCTATRDSQLACRRDQPVLRPVLQVEQFDEGRGSSVATRNDLSEQRCRFAMVLAARAAAERSAGRSIRGGDSREQRPDV